jgi:hypothetical protein
MIRSYIGQRLGELTAEADRFVAEHWPAIEAEARQIRKPARTAEPPAAA